MITETASTTLLVSGTKVSEKDSANKYTSLANSKRVNGIKMNS